MKKYSGLDIARYIINYSNDTSSPISNLKLQKLLYFVQGASLQTRNEVIFTEDIYAWYYGPVVPSVYQFFKVYGSSEIPSIQSYFEIVNCEVTSQNFNENLFDIEDKELIESVVNELRSYSATDLVNITHHQSPWASTKQSQIITIDKMKDFFSHENEC